jgi:hypothetical protein
MLVAGRSLGRRSDAQRDPLRRVPFFSKGVSGTLAVVPDEHDADRVSLVPLEPEAALKALLAVRADDEPVPTTITPTELATQLWGSSAGESRSRGAREVAGLRGSSFRLTRRVKAASGLSLLSRRLRSGE